ncbi:MAG: phosphodiester glycosidase family protein [Lachnospiraceae bacterium]
MAKKKTQKKSQKKIPNKNINQKHNTGGTNSRLSIPKILGRIGLVFATTLGVLVILLLGAVLILIHGPSEQAKKIFTLSTHETSAIKWLPTLFMSEEEYEAILHPATVSDNFVEYSTCIISQDDIQGIASDNLTAGAEELPDVELVDLKGATYQGKLLIIRDPSRVFFGSIDSFGGVGLTLSGFLHKYDALACTNAGGFEDENGTGKGGIPDGIVIQNGAIVYGSAGSTYVGFAGFDADHILHVGNMTGQQALDLGVVNGTNFALGPVLIKDGVRQQLNASGINPRTCIGQTADGTVLLISIEGRLADSLGASFEDLADIMEEYGAINAVNMDGGSSAGMYYEGERITRSCSLVGDRPLPTAIIVSR